MMRIWLAIGLLMVISSQTRADTRSDADDAKLGALLEYDAVSGNESSTWSWDQQLDSEVYGSNSLANQLWNEYFTGWITRDVYDAGMTYFNSMKTLYDGGHTYVTDMVDYFIEGGYDMTQGDHQYDIGNYVQAKDYYNGAYSCYSLAQYEINQVTPIFQAADGKASKIYYILAYHTTPP